LLTDAARVFDFDACVSGSRQPKLADQGIRFRESLAFVPPHGAVLGNHDGDNHVALYQFDLDAELRIVRQAYLLQTQPPRA
jgi:hypothetical protein